MLELGFKDGFIDFESSLGICFVRETGSYVILLYEYYYCFKSLFGFKMSGSIVFIIF
jgi:hypothetical protein